MEPLPKTGMEHFHHHRKFYYSLSSQLNHHPFPSTRQLLSDFRPHSSILLSLDCRINRIIQYVFFLMDVVLCVDFSLGKEGGGVDGRWERLPTRLRS